MGYDTSKIYRLQHDDGHFYFGSTINELRMRLGHHKSKSKTYPNQRVYQHINGEWDKVKIVLIEAFVCSNRDELRRKEDECIRRELENELCLNHNRAFTTKEEDLEKNRERTRAYHEQNKERDRTYHEQNKERDRTYHEQNKERNNARDRAYYQTNKERENARRKAYRQAHIEQERATARERYKTQKVILPVILPQE